MARPETCFTNNVPEGRVPPESNDPSNHGNIPEPMKGPVTNDLDSSFVKQGKEHTSTITLLVQNY